MSLSVSGNEVPKAGSSGRELSFVSIWRNTASTTIQRNSIFPSGAEETGPEGRTFRGRMVRKTAGTPRHSA